MGGSECKLRPEDEGGSHHVKSWGWSLLDSEQAEGVGGGREVGAFPKGHCGGVWWCRVGVKKPGEWAGARSAGLWGHVRRLDFLGRAVGSH